MHLLHILNLLTGMVGTEVCVEGGNEGTRLPDSWTRSTVHKENRHYVSEMRQTEPGLEFLQFKISFFHSKRRILKSHIYDNHKRFNSNAHIVK